MTTPLPTPPRIVILDAYTLNPGDLSWSALEELGSLEIHEHTPPELVRTRAASAPVVLTNKTVLSGETVRALSDLRFIGVLATGTNVVDIAAAAERGIPVCNIPGYATPSVAQAVFALLLELANRTGDHARAVASGRWTACRDFCFWDTPLVELAGLTFGIVGYGAIGHAVATIARALGMRVIVHSRRPVPDEENVGLEEIFTRADVVSLHCPLTPATERLINAERLARMKSSAFLINTGRGPLIDEAALAEALNHGRIAGAGLDVLSREPPPADNPLLTAKNCLVTPHIAWATKAARQRLLTTAVANVRAFLDGAPRKRRRTTAITTHTTMPVTDEPQVRAACDLNHRLNVPQTVARDTTADAAALPGVLADLQATADRPLDGASTLPAAAYTSEAFYRWEVEHVLRAGWQCVAHVSQLPEIGDFITLDLLGEPLIVVRDKDQGVRALSRTCPHRGMDIMPPGFGHGPAEARAGAPGCGHTRLFLCPYHSWTFELDGRLKACPEMQNATGFQRAEWGLREFRVETWHGFIFVNLDGTAPQSPSEQWAELGPHLEKWAAQDLIVVDARSWECPFNWKVIVENFMESYHHVGAHSQSLQPMMPARDTWTEAEHAHFIRCHLPYGAKERGAIAEAQALGTAREIFPLLPGLAERDRFEWGLTLGFPNWLLAYVPDCLIWYRLQPEGPHRHTLLTTLLVPRATTLLPDFAERLARSTSASVGFHLEDMEMCTGVQRGYYSSGYQRGRLSHLEMSIWLFQRYLAARARGTWPTLDRPAAPAQRTDG